MSKLVMGSPLIMQATDCAYTGAWAPTSIASASAQGGRREQRRWNNVVMVMSAVSTKSNRTSNRQLIRRQCGTMRYWKPPLELLVVDEFAMVRRPICSMKAWLRTGGVVPAE